MSKDPKDSAEDKKPYPQDLPTVGDGCFAGKADCSQLSARSDTHQTGGAGAVAAECIGGEISASSPEWWLAMGEGGVGCLGSQHRGTHLLWGPAQQPVEAFQRGIGLNFGPLLVSHSQPPAQGQSYGSTRGKRIQSGEDVMPSAIKVATTIRNIGIEATFF